jgi:ATP-dependent helicase/nuclease subunit A
VCGRIPAPLPAVSGADRNTADIDPRLSQPLPMRDRSTVLHPSLAVPVKAAEDVAEKSAAERTADGAAAAQPFDRGTLIHAMLEQASASRDRRDSYRQLQQAYPDISAALFEQCWRETNQVLSHPDFRELFDPDCYEAAFNEQPVLYRERNMDVYGVIDRLVVYPDKVTVVDYKTHVSATPKTAPELARHYQAQMQLYLSGVKKLWPRRRINGLLLFTHCTRGIEITTE